MAEGNHENPEDIRPRPHQHREEAPVLRDLLESFAFAIIMALVIKNFLAEAYKVPTGSMEPTIHGAQQNGDRILVNRIAELVRDPRRWEVWVFGYPNNQQVNYVKRVTGVGPESLAIIDGDIYTSPYGTADSGLRLLHDEGHLTIQRKPRALQDAIFSRYPRVSPDRTTWSTLEEFQQDWIVPKSKFPGRPEWRHDKNVLADCSTESLVHFRHEIKDIRDPFAEIGPTNHYGEFEVGDLRLDLVCRPEQDGGFIVLEIRDPQHDHRIRARIPVAGEQSYGAVMLGATKLIDIEPGILAANRENRIIFTNVDNSIELELNGTRVASIGYEHLPRMLTEPPRWPAGAGFGVDGARASFLQAQIYRDIYYRGGASRRSIFEPSYDSWRADIPAGHYYVLGDNSPASNDSREWRRKTLKFDESETELHGDTMAVVDPDALENRLENPYTISTEEKSGDIVEESFFVDDFGNKHDISRYGSITGITEAPSPLVPRNLFVGRAYAVFLPLSRMKLIR